MKYFLLLLISSYTLQASAGRPVCNDILEDDLRPFKLASVVLNSKDRELIKDIFESSSPETDKWKEILRTYLHARMRTVPVTHIAASVSHMTALKVQFRTDRKERATSRQIQLPKEFEASVVPYIILVHEWEHRLQTVEMFGDGNILTYHLKGIRRALNPYAIFRAETEAMKAEWEILSVIPQHLIEESIQRLSKMPPSKIRNISLQMLNGHRLSREDYVRFQHQNNRHTVSKIIRSYFGLSK